MCEKCEVGMWEEEQICPSCCRLSRYGEKHRYCKGEMAGLTCLWAYEGIARKLISEAKYRYYFDELRAAIRLDFDRPEMAKFKEFVEKKPVVVPIPLAPKRQRERGFNQAEIIADILCERLCLSKKCVLVRTKETGQQVGRGREERLKAMNNAFEINSKYEILNSKQNYLLVDDVWTTGTTMRECAKALRKVGVNSIWGVIIAR